MRALMPGVQAHLESSDPTMRLAGMAIAKTLIHTLEPTGPQLEFDLDLNNELVKDLLEFKDLPADPGPTEEERFGLSAPSGLFFLVRLILFTSLILSSSVALFVKLVLFVSQDLFVNFVLIAIFVHC